MKKFIVLLVILCVATAAFGADFMWSWDTSLGWASNFDDAYNTSAGELELAFAVDIDEYNSYATEVEEVIAPGANYVTVNSSKLTTDLGAYLGLAGVGVTWVNGYNDPGDEEYSDIGNVGYANAGVAVGLTKSFTTDLNIDAGMLWLSAATNWNLAVKDAAVSGPFDPAMEMLFLVGSVDAVPGLSVEAGVQINGDTAAKETILQVDGAYAYDMAPMVLTVGGSFSSKTEAETQAFGAGAVVDYAVDDMTAFNMSVSFKGDDVEAFSDIGGGIGVTYADFGADVDFAYNVAGGTEDLQGVDVSGFVMIGAAKFRVGYAATDYTWDNNANAAIPAEGGMYMNIDVDF